MDGILNTRSCPDVFATNRECSFPVMQQIGSFEGLSWLYMKIYLYLEKSVVQSESLLPITSISSMWNPLSDEFFRLIANNHTSANYNLMQQTWMRSLSEIDKVASNLLKQHNNNLFQRNRKWGQMEYPWIPMVLQLS